MVSLVEAHGPKKWSTIAAALPGRIGKQCRERWHNHLNPDIRKDAWTTGGGRHHPATRTPPSATNVHTHSHTRTSHHLISGTCTSHTSQRIPRRAQ